MGVGTAIRDVRVSIYDVPTIRPHLLAMTTMHSQAVVLVFITREDGITGVGEATTIGGLAYGEESPESIKTNVETYFAPVLRTCDADDVATTMARLDAHIVGNRFAKCAVETALLDALGQARDMPVCELLGGPRTDRLEVAWTLASGDTARDIEEGERLLAERRHRHFKLKIGKRSVEDDCRHAATIARTFEGRASVRVDVNQAWGREEAIRGANFLERVGVQMIEQPLSASDLDGMRQLRARFDIAIVADEALTGPASAQHVAQARAADGFSIKITQSGGPTKARRVAEIAANNGIGLYGGTMLEGGIGTAASAHLFACLPPMRWETELFGPLLMTEEVLECPLIYRDFSLHVPDGPGLGVRVDHAKLAHFQRH